MKKKKSNATQKMEWLDFLWSTLIKAKAGFKSELSGKTNDLQSHHLAQKPNKKLRYMPENGICVTSGEHKFGFHGGNIEAYKEKAKIAKGYDVYESLLPYVHNKEKFNAIEIEEMLLKELKPYKMEIMTLLKTGNKSFYSRLLDLI